jgi:hypothetical protein
MVVHHEDTINSSSTVFYIVSWAKILSFWTSVAELEQ